MRSTRESAAWAGVALATSFLSMAIVSTQPHSPATSAIAQSVALPIASSNSSLPVVKRVEVAKSVKVTDADARFIDSER